jgi:MFS family permease
LAPANTEQVINNYNALLYQSLGLSNSHALLVGAGYNTWAMLANFLGAFVSDRFGRRRLILFGFISNISMFVVATGLLSKYSDSPTSGWAAAALTFLFLYVFCYGTFIDPNVWVIAAEVFPSHLRADGTAISIALVMAADILWLQLAPTAASTIGWKYYLVFIALATVHTIYFWFRLPEVSVFQATRQ